MEARKPRAVHTGVTMAEGVEHSLRTPRCGAAQGSAQAEHFEMRGSHERPDGATAGPLIGPAAVRGRC
jgi:hypothetical protein